MLKFLIKGLIRDHHRSFFPVLMVSAGVFLTVILYSWITSVMSDIIKSYAQFNTGHVKIMTRAYNELSEQTPNDLSISGAGKVLADLKNMEQDMIWLPRIKFGGLLDIPDAQGITKSQGPVIGLGIDLLNSESSEIKILNLKNALVAGTLPQNKNEILISKEFADKLDVKLGEQATLLSSTMYGSMAMHNFKIAGFITFGFTVLDRSAIVADIYDMQNALDMHDSTSEIVGYSKDMVYSDKIMTEVTNKFNKAYSKSNDEFSPVMITLGSQEGLGEYLYFAEAASFIIVSVFIFAMAVVLWNSGLMNSLRRYGEIGIRLAMGEPKGTLYRYMIYEAVVIGLIGSCIGTLIGVGISYYFQLHPFNFSSMMKDSTVLMPAEVGLRVTALSYIIGFIPGVLAPVLGTMAAGIGIYRRKTSQLFKELEV
ncbi:ABC transporter permease [bacterium]